VTAYVGVNPQLCTGCRTCMLACSLAFFNAFNPSKSKIIVEGDEETSTFDIRFTSDCVPCQVCAESCAYNALAYLEKE